MKLETIEKNHLDYTIKIHIHHDEHMGEPWKEHDGHGIVSDWVTRNKKPGELVLFSDRGRRYYYDFVETLKIAKRDGWGLGEKEIAKLAIQLGRKPTAKQILNEAVMRDFEYLRGWCNNEWVWLGYVCEIESPDGAKVNQDLDSCWGYDDREYMISEAEENAKYAIDRHISETISEEQESQAMACRDIETVA